MESILDIRKLDFAYGQQLAPFSALAAAATATGRLHVGTLVLANDFRHPVLVAHEAATLHHLSGGRFELGLGAGWYRPEYEAAGLDFQPARQRIDRLEEALTIISGLLEGAQVDQAGTAYQVTGLGLDGAGSAELAHQPGGVVSVDRMRDGLCQVVKDGLS